MVTMKGMIRLSKIQKLGIWKWIRIWRTHSSQQIFLSFQIRIWKCLANLVSISKTLNNPFKMDSGLRRKHLEISKKTNLWVQEMDNSNLAITNSWRALCLGNYTLVNKLEPPNNLKDLVVWGKKLMGMVQRMKWSWRRVRIRKVPMNFNLDRDQW